MGALGSMLLSERAADQLLGLLTAEAFYRPAHGEIFRAMQRLVEQGKAIDVLTLREELILRGSLAQVGGMDYLLELAEFTPSASNASHYANIVLDKATLRQLQEAGREIVGLVQAPDEEDTVESKVDQAEQLIFEVGRKRLGQDFVPIRTLARDFLNDVDRLLETKTPTLGIPSGFYELDEMTTGFYGGDFTIVAARPSMGKTSLVLNFALNVAAKGAGNVAIFSLEMSAVQLVRRMVSMLSGVSSNVLKKTSLSKEDWQALANACETLHALPIHIDDSSDVSGMEIRGKCRRLKSQGGLGLVVVDYLQLMRSSRKVENRNQEIGEIARSLKALAKELDVPVLALSQLNRSVEMREDKRPMLGDLRESGSIEAEADLVMFIYRDAYYKAKELNADQQNWDPDRTEEAEIIIAKHRNGPVGKVMLGFQPSYARFRNLFRGDQ